MPRPAHVLVVALAAATVVAAAALPAGAAPAPHSAAAGSVPDYCRGQCGDVLPPGENGSATAAQIVAFKMFGTKPAHTDDQLNKYAALVDQYTGLNNGTSAPSSTTPPSACLPTRWRVCSARAAEGT